jgi:hypothetical protein
VFFGAYRHIGMATGANWPDALAGGALMGTLGGPLMLARPGTSTLDSGQRTVFPNGSPSIHTGIVFGGPTIVPTGAGQAMGALISGPGGYTEQANQPV